MVVTETPFTLTCMVGADAAFLFSLLGISLQGNLPNIYNMETKSDKKKFWNIAVMKAGFRAVFRRCR